MEGAVVKNRTTLAFAKMPKTYDSLVREFGAPRVLHDKIDLDNASEIVEAMAGHDLTPDQEDYFDLLSDLVDQYDREHNPVLLGKASPAEVLRFLIDQHGMTASALGELLGDRALGSRVLRGERELSKAHIRTVSAHFKINPALLI